MAVPGHPFDSRASGCNMLIRDGALLVRGADDVLAALDGPLAARPRPAPEADIAPPPDTRTLAETSALHRQILDRLGPSPLAEDQLIRDLNLPVGRLGPELLHLELEGRIERRPGGLLSRVQSGRRPAPPAPDRRRPSSPYANFTARNCPKGNAPRTAPGAALTSPRGAHMFRRHIAVALSRRNFNAGCRRRIPCQGQDDQQVSRRRLHRARLVRPCPRPAAQGRLGRYRPRLRHEVGGRGQFEEAHPRDHRGAEDRRHPDPRHRPRPRGRGDLLAPARGAGGLDQEGQEGQPRHLQRDHQVGGDRGDGASAPGRHGTGRGLPRPPRARLPGRLQPQPGALAQAAGRQVRRPGAVGLPAPDRRARDGDRGVPGPRILDRVGCARHPARPDLHRAPDLARRQEARQVRHRHLGRGRSRGPCRRKPRPDRHAGRGQARQPATPRRRS